MQDSGIISLIEYTTKPITEQEATSCQETENDIETLKNPRFAAKGSCW